MADVTIKNMSKRMQVYTLAGAHLREPAKDGNDRKHRYVSVKRVTIHRPANGNIAVRVRHLPMPQSLRIGPGEEMTVDRAATHAPMVRKAIVAGTIKVLHDETKTADFAAKKKAVADKKAADEKAKAETANTAPVTPEPAQVVTSDETPAAKKVAAAVTEPSAKK